MCTTIEVKINIFSEIKSNQKFGYEYIIKKKDKKEAHDKRLENSNICLTSFQIHLF